MSTVQIIALVLSSNVITSLLTIWANKSLIKSKAKSNEAMAADLLSKTYSKLIKDLHDEIARLKEINEAMAENRNKLMAQIKELENEVEALRKTVTRLTKQLKRHENNGGK